MATSVNYINSASGNRDVSTLFANRLNLGSYDYMYVKPAVASGSILEGVRTTQGEYDSDGNKVANLATDRAPNVPSGFNSSGATYGDGKQNNTFSFAPDYVNNKASGSYEYNTPLGPVRKAFSALSS